MQIQIGLNHENQMSELAILILLPFFVYRVLTR